LAFRHHIVIMENACTNHDSVFMITLLCITVNTTGTAKPSTYLRVCCSEPSASYFRRALCRAQPNQKESSFSRLNGKKLLRDHNDHAGARFLWKSREMPPQINKCPTLSEDKVGHLPVCLLPNGVQTRVLLPKGVWLCKLTCQTICLGNFV
jgi:hypothetical protein